MRTKVTLVLLFLNVALFFFIVYVNKPAGRPTNETQPYAEAITNVQAFAISSTSGTANVRLEHTAEGWILTEPVEWPANEFAVKRILSEVQNLRSETSFAVSDLEKNGQSLADYGLEKPSITVTVTQAKLASQAPALPPVILRIGDAVKLGNRLYVLSPDGKRIHVVNRSLADSLTVKQEELRSDEIFTIQPYEARSISIQPIRTRIEQEQGRWSFGMPIVARASKAEVEVTITQLNNLRTRTFLDSKTDAARTGLESPVLRITIDGQKRHETLLIGAPVEEQPAPASASTLPAREYYTQMEDRIPNRKSSPIFTTNIPNELLDNLRGAQEKLRERRILDFDPSAVTGITLSQREGEPELALQRLDANQSNSVAAWQYIQRNPAGTPVVTSADREIVQRLIKTLTQLSAEKFVNNALGDAEKDNYGLGRPTRHVTLSLAGAPGAAATTSKLLLGLVDKTVYAKVDNAPHVYAVSPEILNQVSIEPLHYRERLLRELPAGAQITHLTLTDPGSKQVLLDLPVPPAPAAGKSGTGDRSPLEEVVARLRTLRAKSFRANTFTNTVNIGGEERPWRFQLDAKLALGGNAGSTAAVSSLFFSDRVGGTTQWVGSPDLNVVFEAEQELIDALFKLTYGSRDPGPTPPAAGEAPKSP